MKFSIVLLSFYLIASRVLLAGTPFVKTETDDVLKKLFTSCLPLFLYSRTISQINLTRAIENTLKRIALLQTGIQQLGYGNYRQENIAIDSRDEIAQPFTNYNTLSNFNKNFLSTFIDTMHVSNNASEKLDTSTQNTANAIDHITKNIETVDNHIQNESAKVFEAKSTLEQIAPNLSRRKANIERQSTSVIKSVSTIEEMSANIQSINKTVHENMQAINEFKKAPEEGNKAVTGTATVAKTISGNSENLLKASRSIQTIASQTALMAMNAAIKAAHTGETGKGFAVVADEIKKLTEESKIHEKNITSVLKELKTQIETLESAYSSVEHQFATIMKLLELLQNRSHKIMNAMREQNSGSTQVLQSAKHITEITEQVKLGSVEMVKRNHETAKENQKMVKSSEEITTNMKNISLSAGNIKKSIELVLVVGGEEKDALKKVSEQLAQRKV